MAETYPGLLNQIKTIMTGLSPAKKITFLFFACAIISGFYFLLVWAGKPEFGYLATNLSSDDAGVILSKLKEKKIRYQISPNGNAILVPEEILHELKMELATMGLPQGAGVGFEIFDNTKLGVTEFAQNINYQRALQGEICRTINSFDAVVNSRVHIVMPSKSLFVEKEEPATASVVIKLRHGAWLSNAQIKGIINLVASSVSGLYPENVAIIDNTGKILTESNERATAIKTSSNQIELQRKIEKNLENRVKTMLDTALGTGKSIVRVSCDIGFIRQEKTEEFYLPENQVIRSEQISNTVILDNSITPSGIPGVESNITPAKMGANKSEENVKSKKLDKIINYEIGKTIKHIIEPVGTIERLSVAVMIDGSYKAVIPVVNAEKSKEEKDKKEISENMETPVPENKYLPRTQEEMRMFEGIVKSAVNFNEKRGDIVEIINIPFETSKIFEDEEPEEPDDLFYKIMKFKPFFKQIFAGLAILFCFIFIVRPLLKWLTSDSVKDMQLLTQLPKTVAELEREYAHGIPNIPVQNTALSTIAANKEATAELMKDWLNE